MSPHEYFSMKLSRNTIVTMEMAEIIFKSGSILLVQYDANTNLPQLFGCHNYYVIEVIVSLDKCITDPKK